MTRYNDEPLAGGEGTEEIEGYREAVDRILKFLDQGGESGTASDIRWAVDEGLI